MNLSVDTSQMRSFSLFDDSRFSNTCMHKDIILIKSARSYFCVSILGSSLSGNSSKIYMRCLGNLVFEQPTLDCITGHDPRVLRSSIEPHVRLHAECGTSLGISLFLYPSNIDVSMLTINK